ANAGALVYGVVPKARRGAVAAHVASFGLVAPPRTATEVLTALGENGRMDDVLRILSDRTNPGWANILAQGGTFTWEVWRPSDADGDSMSHGWGANVLVAIQRLLLGVRPAGPGFQTMEIVPALGVLDTVAGTVPTPRGPVSVSWSPTSGQPGAVDLALTVPPNARASVRLSTPAAAVLTESGSPIGRTGEVRIAARSDTEATIDIGAGTYQFRIAVPRT
ncbi:MAG TPA: alpha-L-rhamnosidase C-terminal domain-containing protein, partial [Acidimicrobiales bacterium]|nr:alpha-L-rhamnosidase C-terminal domain-containing protein [Acidimicrobiales bacterium]